MTTTGLVPLMRYRDVGAAIDWLTATFGLTAHNIVRDGDDAIAYAELKYGNGIVMLGPVGDSVLDKLLRQPDELGGIGTQSCYLAVDDVEAHFRHSCAAGAEIVVEFGSDETGDRAYAARDPEGHIWNFGAYSPWRSSLAPKPADLHDTLEPRARAPRGQAALAAGVAALAVATSAAVFNLAPGNKLEVAISTNPPTVTVAPVTTSTTERFDPQAVEQATRAAQWEEEAAQLRATLERETYARREAARSAAAVRAELERLKETRAGVESELTRLKSDLAREQELRRAAEAAVVRLKEQAAMSQRPAHTDTQAIPATTGSLKPPQAADGPATSSPGAQAAPANTATQDAATQANLNSAAAISEPAPVAPPEDGNHGAGPTPDSSSSAPGTDNENRPQDPDAAKSRAQGDQPRANSSATSQSANQRRGRVERVAKPKSQSQAKPKPKKEAAKPAGGTDPLFMYD
jgi:uncharacterized glyoxalase superfamily protein PhnB